MDSGEMILCLYLVPQQDNKDARSCAVATLAISSVWISEVKKTTDVSVVKGGVWIP